MQLVSSLEYSIAETYFYRASNIARIVTSRTYYTWTWMSNRKGKKYMQRFIEEFLDLEEESNIK
jgi:hypothetical protein